MKIAVIRMKGKFSLAPDIRCTLESLRLNRLFACVLLPDNPTSKGMLQSCKDAVSFGPVDEPTVALLLQKRGRTEEGKRLGKEQAAKISKEFYASTKKLPEFGVIPIFRLSPPKGGFGSRKASVPQGGPLGKNPGISELIARMA